MFDDVFNKSIQFDQINADTILVKLECFKFNKSNIESNKINEICNKMVDSIPLNQNSFGKTQLNIAKKDDITTFDDIEFVQINSQTLMVGVRALHGL